MTVAAQFHSHRGVAGLSEVDLLHGFSVPGFVTCVVPFYANPSEEPAAWGWWRYDEQAWREISPPVMTSQPVTYIGFDAKGVRAL